MVVAHPVFGAEDTSDDGTLLVVKIPSMARSQQ